MNRRHFLMSAGTAFAASRMSAAPNPLSRVCISTWSFHGLFPSYGAKGKIAQPIELLDFPEMIADRYHVHRIEVTAPSFTATTPAYFKDLQARLNKAHSRIVNIPVDIEELWEKPSLSSTDAQVSGRAISLYSKWIENANVLGVLSVRCDPGKINLKDLSPTIESYKKLVAFGKSKNVEVIVENHGSAAAHPEELAEILKSSGAGALPDIGNFPDDATRERGLKMLFPLARGVCHAKLIPDKFDLSHYINMSKELGFKGVYSIEAGGRGDSYEAVQQIQDAVVKSL
jgi:hypothetical protein